MAQSLESDTDFTLIAPSAWVTVGPFSVFLRRTDEGAEVSVFSNGNEDQDPLWTVTLDDKAAMAVSPAGITRWEVLTAPPG